MPEDPINLWKNQPMDSNAIHLERLVTRRARDLSSATRTEILTSIGAALFFVAVMSWRLPVPGIGVAGVLLWAAFTLYRYRSLIRPPKQAGDLAATGLDHYRTVLQRRRDHLKNAWIWHGPLLLACLIPLPTVIQQFHQRLKNIIPFFALLAFWIILGIYLRRQKAAELEREIKELGLGQSIV